MDGEKRKNTKWYWTAIGTIIVTIIADNISETTKHIPVVNVVVDFFKWIYVSVARLLNSQVKVWILLVVGVLMYLVSRLLRRTKQEEPRFPAFYNYRLDRFKNWTWKWRWENFGRGWEIS